MTAQRLERRLRTAADRAREAETAIRVAGHFDGPEAPQLRELRAKYAAALGEAAAVVRAIMDVAGDAGCPFCVRSAAGRWGP